jgi:hypothetical protein
VKLVHLKVITPPGDRLARSLDANSGQRANRAAWTVIAGNPLGEHQRHLAGVHRNLKVCVINVAGRVGEINVQADGLGGKPGS